MIIFVIMINCNKKQADNSLLTSLFYSPPPTNSPEGIINPIQEGGEIQANIVAEKLKSGEYQINPGGSQVGILSIIGLLYKFTRF